MKYENLTINMDMDDSQLLKTITRQDIHEHELII